MKNLLKFSVLNVAILLLTCLSTELLKCEVPIQDPVKLVPVNLTLKATASEQLKIYEIDLNYDDQPDFYIRHSLIDGKYYAEIYTVKNLTTETTIKFTGEKMPQIFMPNQFVHSSENSWLSVHYSPTSQAIPLDGAWLGTTNKFLGFRFVDNGITFFGWICLSIPKDANYLKINSYAINTKANEDIQTPYIDDTIEEIPSEVLPEIPSGVQENLTENVLFFNSFNQTLSINAGAESKIKIFDYTGNLMYEYNNVLPKSTIDFSGLRKGVYFAVCSIGKNMYMRKFFI